jgi:gliding motility associated protien GldN
MKNPISKFCLILPLGLLMVQIVTAQQPRRNSNNRNQTTPPAAAQPAPAPATPDPAPPATNSASQQTMQTAPKPEQKEADIKLPVFRRSLRPDHIFKDTFFNKDREPLPYEDIRPDDATYIQRVWREVDIHEKLNLPFSYKANTEGGDQLFINMLLNAIKKEEITAFDARVDDRFSTPMAFKDIAEMIIGKPKNKRVPDYVNDPNGDQGLMKDTVVGGEYNPDLIERYWIKEDWIYDKESSRMYSRIIGIAPILTLKTENNTFFSIQPLFWVYYPDLRPMLARSDVYIGKNMGNRMTWEELFEGRMFSSRIIKSTINNPNDMFIEQYVKDPILALLEGENIKDKIFSYEQELWEY